MQMLKMAVLIMVVLWASLSFAAAVPQRPDDISIESANVSWAYVRGQTAVVNLRINNASKKDLPKCELKTDISGIITCSKTLDSIPAGSAVERISRIDTQMLKAGQYSLKVSLVSDGNTVCSKEFPFWVARKWNPDRLRVWLWPHRKFGVNVYQLDEEAKKQLAWYADKGFNSFSPGGGIKDMNEVNFGGMTEGKFRLYDYMLVNGMEATFSAWKGFWPKVDNTDAYFKIERASGGLEPKLTNPFHPVVMRKQDELNTELMQVIRQFPGIGLCYFEGEIEDIMPDSLPLSENSYPAQDTVPHSFIQPGVIPDNDIGYVHWLYRHKWGDGLPIASERLAHIVHKYRPDIKVFADPIRRTTVYNRFRGVDIVSNWSYTNPDPKLMLAIETLVANAKVYNQGIISTVTLLNYPGEVAPKDKGWVLMGPDRLVETSWINLSRNPDALSYYFGSTLDPFEESGAMDANDPRTRPSFYPFQLYPETAEALKKFVDVVKPYGPMIRNLHRPSCKVAVLCSDSSRVYSESKPLVGYYPNNQINCFYSLLAMAHIPADVVFDQTITEFGLDDYKVLVLPKCDTLTESVYKKILDFKAKGGTVVSDQYLRAEIPDVIKLDFDFTYRNNVSANALIAKEDFGEKTDNITREASKQSVEGVTADEDQKRMEGYAGRLSEALKGKVCRQIDCQSPTVLLNELEYDGVRYLFVINDKREYSQRLIQYKAMLDKGVSQNVTISVDSAQPDSLKLYDILEHKAVSFKQNGKSVEFDVNLPAAGGKIIAITTQKPEKIEILAPDKISERGLPVGFDICIKDEKGLLVAGVSPLQVKITDPAGKDSEFSDYYAAKSGLCKVDFTAGKNDLPGKWQLKATDLMTGIETEKVFVVE